MYLFSLFGGIFDHQISGMLAFNEDFGTVEGGEHFFFGALREFIKLLGLVSRPAGHLKSRLYTFLGWQNFWVNFRRLKSSKNRVTGS